MPIIELFELDLAQPSRHGGKILVHHRGEFGQSPTTRGGLDSREGVGKDLFQLRGATAIKVQSLTRLANQRALARPISLEEQISLVVALYHGIAAVDRSELSDPLLCDPFEGADYRHGSHDIVGTVRMQACGPGGG